MSEDPADAAPARSIRSFVLRAGRLTEAQSKALSGLWPRFGIEDEGGEIRLEQVFGRRAPLVIEIGFGNGEATWQMALAEPQKDFIGIEVHRPGVGSLLQALESRQLNNVRIARCDAVEFMRNRLPERSVSELRIYFPDPWPKKRHHKRRIIQSAFLDLIAAHMIHGGLVHLATDWQPYAEHMLETFTAHAAFRNCAHNGGFSQKPSWRPGTKYEARGERLGHQVFDLLFTVHAAPA